MNFFLFLLCFVPYCISGTKIYMPGEVPETPPNTVVRRFCITNWYPSMGKYCAQNFGYPGCMNATTALRDGDKKVHQLTETISGITCRNWINENDKRKKGKVYKFDDNFCRNPDGREAPWCFTDDTNVPWDFCLRDCSSDMEWGFVMKRGNQNGPIFNHYVEKIDSSIDIVLE